MPQLAPTAGSVNLGRFIKFLINSRNGCKIYDGSKAAAFPQVGNQNDRTEAVFIRQNIGYRPFQAKTAHHAHNYPAGCAEHGIKKSVDDNPGNKIGQDHRRLDSFFGKLMPYFINHQREDDGSGKAENQFFNADDNIVFQRAPKIRPCQTA